MNKVLMTAIVSSFAAMALAQSPTPAADAAAARQKASPENVKKATEDKGYTQRAGEAASKAAESKDMPKVMPDTASKRKAVGSTTEDKGYTQRAGEAAAKSGGTGMAPDAKAARRAASRENVHSTTEDKGYTQRAGEAAAKVREEEKKAPK